MAVMEAAARCSGTSETLNAEASAAAHAADDGTKRASPPKQSTGSLNGGSQYWITLAKLLHVRGRILGRWSGL